MIEASTTRNPSTPTTRASELTTEPMAQVPETWNIGKTEERTSSANRSSLSISERIRPGPIIIRRAALRVAAFMPRTAATASADKRRGGARLVEKTDRQVLRDDEGLVDDRPNRLVLEKFACHARGVEQPVGVTGVAERVEVDARFAERVGGIQCHTAARVRGIEAWTDHRNAIAVAAPAGAGEETDEKIGRGRIANV